MPQNIVDILTVQVEGDLKPIERSLKTATAITAVAGENMTRDFERVDRSVRNTNRSIGRLPLVIGAFALVAAGATIKMLNFASGVEEAGNKADVVFGGSIGRVRQQLTELGDRVGRSRFELLQMAATLQDTFVPLGFARDEAAALSVAMTDLAVDVGSFNNIASEQVARDFQSAIVGNHETVRKYGVVLTEASLKAEAYSTGIAKIGAELTIAEKVQARLNIIQKGTADAHGDAERTASSYANQVQNLRAQIGEYVVALTDGHIDTAADRVGVLADAFDRLEKAQTRANIARKASRIDGFSYSGTAASNQQELDAINAEVDRIQRETANQSGLRRTLLGQGGPIGRRAAVYSRDLDITRDQAFDLIRAGNDSNFADVLARQRDRERARIGLNTRESIAGRDFITRNDIGTFGGEGTENATLFADNRRAQFAGQNSRAAREESLQRGGIRQAAKEQVRATAIELDGLSDALETADEKTSNLDVAFESLGHSLSTSLADALVEGELSLDTLLDSIKDFAKQALAEFLRVQVFKRGLSYLFGGGEFAFGAGAHPGERQGGGSAHSNLPILVGERGPEIFVPHTAGRIMNNPSMGMSGGGITFNQVNNIDLGAAQSARAEALAVAPIIEARSVAAVKDLLQRGGSYAAPFRR